MLVAFLGGIAVGIAASIDETLGLVALAVVGVASSIMLGVGIVAKGVQVGRRWP